MTSNDANLFKFLECRDKNDPKLSAKIEADLMGTMEYYNETLMELKDYEGVPDHNVWEHLAPVVEVIHELMHAEYPYTTEGLSPEYQAATEVPITTGDIHELLFWYIRRDPAAQ